MCRHCVYLPGQSDWLPPRPRFQGEHRRPAACMFKPPRLCGLLQRSRMDARVNEEAERIDGRPYSAPPSSRPLEPPPGLQQPHNPPAEDLRDRWTDGSDEPCMAHARIDTGQPATQARRGGPPTWRLRGALARPYASSLGASREACASSFASRMLLTK